MRALAQFSALILAVTLGTPATAESVQYTTSWTAGQIIPRMGNVLPKIGELTTVSRGDIILAARLLPAEAGRIDSPILDVKGKELAPAGAELFSLETEGGKIFCLAGSKRENNSSRFYFRKRNFRQTCFSDVDADGVFESYFRTLSEAKGLPSFSGRTSKKPKAIQPAAYVLVEPKELGAVYYVALEYRGNANARENHIFETVFGGNLDRQSLTERMIVKQTELPAIVSFLGARFQLFSGEKSVARLRVISPMKRSRFGVGRSVKLRFY